MNEAVLEILVIEAQKLLAEAEEIIKQKIKDDYLPLFQDIKKNINGEIKGVVFAEELDVLDKSSLISISKKYMPHPPCNGIAALKVDGLGDEKDTTYVYLAYVLDRNLLPIDKNKYVIIKAKSLSDDASALFESNLIILV